MLVISDDGYIRLSFSAIQSVCLTHLISGLDEDTPMIILGGAVQTAITGYTEWLSDTAPTITIGWDWEMHTASNHIQLRRIGAVRSNLMLRDLNQTDVGPMKTQVMLEMLIDALDWSSIVQNHINVDYAQ